MATYTVSGSDGKTYGPVEEGLLVQWAHDGRINATTLMTCNETGQHLAAHMVPALAPVVGLPPPMVSALTRAPRASAAATADAHAMLMFQARRKSAGVAYLLWFFFGMFGAHRFYTGNTGTAVAMLLITVLSIPLTLALIGIVTIWITAVWALVDLFLIPGMVERFNMGLANQIQFANR